MNGEKLKPDVVLKNFWQDNERFASLFNALVFQGKEVIQPESLQEVDTEVPSIIEFKKYRETLLRSRDVVKKTAYGIEFVILGIESQMKIHYAMPLRVMVYDALGYLKEYQSIARKYRKNKDKMTASEFLSSFKKSDKLHPIITIVVYYGEDPWDGPLSLKDMIVDMPSEMDNVFSDHRMNLLQIRESSKYHFNNEDVQIVFEISSDIFAKQFDKIKKKYGKREIASELAMVIGTITESEVFIHQATKCEGSEINMCNALEELKQQGVANGIQQVVIKLIEMGMSIEMIKEASGLDDKEIESLKNKIKM